MEKSTTEETLKREIEPGIKLYSKAEYAERQPSPLLVPKVYP